MERKIQKIEIVNVREINKKKVCAYARVSVEKDNLLNSLSNQVSYYNELISSNIKWEFAGIYADKGISGTTIKRDQFQKMLEDCRNGKIDLILTKSISRFARNTLDLLNVVRELKQLNIAVYFERENINTLTKDGEFMLTILASFSQEESRSISENAKWAIRKKFEKGIGNNYILYGYRWDGEKFNVVEEEAKVIRYIYKSYLDGMSSNKIANKLKEKSVRGINGALMQNSTVKSILTNEKYTGNSILQKTYRQDSVNKKKILNSGQLDKFYVENTHPRIIDDDSFYKVKAIYKERNDYIKKNNLLKKNCFTGKVKCKTCSVNFHRVRKKALVCSNKKKGIPCKCDSLHLDINSLKKISCKILGIEKFDEYIFEKRIKSVDVYSRNEIVFNFNDKTKKIIDWDKENISRDWSQSRKELYCENLRINKPFGYYINRVFCGKCRNKYDMHRRKLKTKTTIYRKCGKYCGNSSIRQEVLDKMVKEIIGTNEISIKKFDEKIEKIEVLSDEVFFYLKNNMILKLKKEDYIE